MADTKNISDLTMVTVNAKALGDVLDIGDRQVRNLAEEGILVRNSHGKYLLVKSVKNYIINLKLAKSCLTVKSDFDSHELDLDHEKAKHEHMKSMITEIKLQLLKGQVHKSSDVGSVITDMFTKFRSKMLALPSKMAVKLQGKPKEEIKEMLLLEISDALRELADYNPADYYSNEYADLEEDIFSGAIEGGGGHGEEQGS